MNAILIFVLALTIVQSEHSHDNEIAVVEETIDDQVEFKIQDFPSSILGD